MIIAIIQPLIAYLRRSSSSGRGYYPTNNNNRATTPSSFYYSSHFYQRIDKLPRLYHRSMLYGFALTPLHPDAV